MAAKFYLGIDLGTTNSALAYCRASGGRTEVLHVAQLSAPGLEVQEPALPSFCYIATPAEERAGTCTLPALPETAARTAAGVFAREQLAVNPGRVISSAKSWLCHGGVSRTDRYLPWGSDEVDAARKLSPIETSAEYLRHLKAAWNAQMAGADSRASFDEQVITVTVPASFDDAAQRFTLEAARLAGYPEHVRLLEEPQAAFYRFLELHQGRAAEALPELTERALLVLVVDIGGGTTDFSLFELSGGDGAVRTTRVAVGDHLLLGGDNIDLALAHLAERKLDRRLSAKQWANLVYQCRLLKERALSGEGEAEEESSIALPGEGRSIFGSVLSVTLAAHEIRQLVLEGFFPPAGRGEAPRRRESALSEFGLPYAADSAITRYLVQFLGERSADCVLFAGGTLSSSALRERLLNALADIQGFRPKVLELDDLSLAVSRGAAHYSKLRAESAERIRAAYPRTLYLELHSEEPSAVPLLCVLPFGSEPGGEASVTEQSFKLTLDRPVRFQLWTSTHRRSDAAGDVVRPQTETRKIKPGGLMPGALSLLGHHLAQRSP